MSEQIKTYMDLEATYENHLRLPVGTVIADAHGYWANAGRRHVKTSENTYAVFFGKVTDEQVSQAVAEKRNNISPAPLGSSAWWVVQVGATPTPDPAPNADVIEQAAKVLADLWAKRYKLRDGHEEADLQRFRSEARALDA